MTLVSRLRRYCQILVIHHIYYAYIFEKHDIWHTWTPVVRYPSSGFDLNLLGGGGGVQYPFGPKILILTIYPLRGLYREKNMYPIVKCVGRF